MVSDVRPCCCITSSFLAELWHESSIGISLSFPPRTIHRRMANLLQLVAVLLTVISTGGTRLRSQSRGGGGRGGSAISPPRGQQAYTDARGSHDDAVRYDGNGGTWREEQPTQWRGEEGWRRFGGDGATWSPGNSDWWGATLNCCLLRSLFACARGSYIGLASCNPCLRAVSYTHLTLPTIYSV